MSVMFRGRLACDCLAKWLPVYEKELLRRGVIKHNIDIYQLIGNAAASSKTHSKGGAYDIAQTSDLAIKIAREMGAAAWHRTPAQGFTHHQHGVLINCPHNGPAKYQIDMYRRGYNGLASWGRDDGPRVQKIRTWRQGIEWAKALQRPRPVVNRVTKARAKMLDILDLLGGVARSRTVVRQERAKIRASLDRLPKS